MIRFQIEVFNLAGIMTSNCSYWVETSVLVCLGPHLPAKPRFLDLIYLASFPLFWAALASFQDIPSQWFQVVEAQRCEVGHAFPSQGPQAHWKPHQVTGRPNLLWLTLHNTLLQHDFDVDGLVRFWYRGLCHAWVALARSLASRSGSAHLPWASQKQRDWWLLYKTGVGARIIARVRGVSLDAPDQISIVMRCSARQQSISCRAISASGSMQATKAWATEDSWFRTGMPIGKRGADQVMSNGECLSYPRSDSEFSYLHKCFGWTSILTRRQPDRCFQAHTVPSNHVISIQCNHILLLPNTYDLDQPETLTGSNATSGRTQWEGSVAYARCPNVALTGPCFFSPPLKQSTGMPWWRSGSQGEEPSTEDGRMAWGDLVECWGRRSLLAFSKHHQNQQQDCPIAMMVLDLETDHALRLSMIRAWPARPPGCPDPLSEPRWHDLLRLISCRRCGWNDHVLESSSFSVSLRCLPKAHGHSCPRHTLPQE